jgi:receptor expression-enhancing protein 5/6
MAGKLNDISWTSIFQIYWTVFAAFSLLDFWAELIMSFLPIYWLSKAIFLLYLSMPQTRGAQKMYVKYVDPAVTEIDNYLKNRAALKVEAR